SRSSNQRSIDSVLWPKKPAPRLPSCSRRIKGGRDPRSRFSRQKSPAEPLDYGNGIAGLHPADPFAGDRRAYLQGAVPDESSFDTELAGDLRGAVAGRRRASNSSSSDPADALAS